MAEKTKKIAIKTLPWLLRMLNGILHGLRLLFRLKLLIDFSISKSCTGLM